jgi:phosphatidylserine decarboxylase
MKHSEKAALTARKLVGLAFAALLALLAVAFLVKTPFVLDCLTWVLIALCALFAGFTLYFFRDPNPVVPDGANLVVSPGHGTVDVVDTATEPDFTGGECRRVSIFLSVFDVHVQNAPVTGRVALFKHTPGQYLNAMRTDSAKFNENVLIGLDASEPPGEKIGVRLIAGLIARRIVPWVAQNDDLQRGDRISLIKFGSRVEIYLPLRAKIRVKPGDKVKGGETVIASFD